MGKGRKPIPTALKVLKGSFIRHPELRNDEEPVVAVAAPDVPATLGQYGREEWGRITSEMAELGVLTRIERSAIEKYCLAYQKEREAEDVVAKDGRFYHTAKGDIREHPASKAAREYANQCFRALIEFGMTPSSRSKIRVPKKTEGDTDEQRMFG